jgi:hypothetical protein
VKADVGGRRVLLLSAAFGVAAALLKGDSPGLRGALGNLSAPWLLVAFLAALGCGTLLRGLVVGTAATVVALVAFYVTATLVLAGHLGGGGFAVELSKELAANRIYLLFGLVTGPLLGVSGAWVGRRHRDLTWLVVGGLLAGEIVVVALVQGRELLPAPLYFRWGVDDWTAYLAELACGLAVLGVAVVALWRRRAQPTG